MTSPQDITVSLEWAKKLKEAGWPQKTVDPESPADKAGWTVGSWYWVSGTLALKCPIFFVECDCGQVDGGPSYWEVDDESDVFAAPTAEEILRRLPRQIKNQFQRRGTYYLYIKATTRSADSSAGWEPCFDLRYKASYRGRKAPSKMLCSTREDSLANAAAAMYCYLAENKLLPSA